MKIMIIKKIKIKSGLNTLYRVRRRKLTTTTTFVVEFGCTAVTALSPFHKG